MNDRTDRTGKGSRHDQGNPDAGGAEAASGRAESAEDLTPEQRVEMLAAMMHADDARIRKSVAIALGNLGTQAACAPLCEMLSDEDEGVRVLVCQSLGRLADPASVESLLACVHDTSEQVRSGVLFALANIAAHGGLSERERADLFTPIVVMAFDPSDGVRADAAATLGTLNDSRATEPLLALVDDANARVRANACASLGITASESLESAQDALDALIGRISDDEEKPLVRVSALDGLARKAQRGQLDGEDARFADAVRIACRLAGASLPVNPSEAKEQPDVQEDAQPSDAAAVGASDEDREPTERDVRATAVWALGMLCEGDFREHADAGNLSDLVFDTLVAALHSEDAWCQRYAIEALGRIGGDREVKALRALAARIDPAPDDSRKNASLSGASGALSDEATYVLKEVLAAIDGAESGGA